MESDGEDAVPPNRAGTALRWDGWAAVLAFDVDAGALRCWGRYRGLPLHVSPGGSPSSATELLKAQLCGCLSVFGHPGSRLALNNHAENG